MYISYCVHYSHVHLLTFFRVSDGSGALCTLGKDSYHS